MDIATYVIIDPRESSMGAATGEPGHNLTGYEKQHRRRIARQFAVASKEVTLEQFRRFRPDFEGPVPYGPDDDGPVITVSWIDAALYCRWLSENEGIAEDQMCYVLAPDPKNGVIVAADCLEGSGYRLPTEAEWECVCRAGTATTRPCGDADVLLPRYAWFSPHAQGKAHPVGRLRPNDWGLFDMLGNAAEWCHDPDSNYPDPTDGLAVLDAPRTDLTAFVDRVQRGGCYGHAASYLRSAQRELYDQRINNAAFGFRVARTMPEKVDDP